MNSTIIIVWINMYTIYLVSTRKWVTGAFLGSCEWAHDKFIERDVKLVINGRPGASGTSENRMNYKNLIMILTENNENGRNQFRKDWIEYQYNNDFVTISFARRANEKNKREWGKNVLLIARKKLTVTFNWREWIAQRPESAL